MAGILLLKQVVTARRIYSCTAWCVNACRLVLGQVSRANKTKRATRENMCRQEQFSSPAKNFVKQWRQFLMQNLLRGEIVNLDGIRLRHPPGRGVIRRDI